MTNIEKHLKLITIFNIIYSIINLVIAGSFYLVYIWFGIFKFMKIEGDTLEIILLNNIDIIFFILFVLFLVVAIIGSIGAFGVSKRKQWGRFILFGVSAISIVNIPLGTALGIYTIWVLTNEEVKQTFINKSHI